MIQQLADWITYDLLGLDATSHLGVALDFFIYDTVKILMLLFTISSLMGVVNAYFPIERLRNYLMTHRLHGMQYLLASVFGAITPFCSCSSIPLFIGFVKGGIPLGVTFAFLITSPLVNEVAVAMFLGSFGMKVTVIYVVSGVRPAGHDRRRPAGADATGTATERVGETDSEAVHTTDRGMGDRPRQLYPSSTSHYP